MFFSNDGTNFISHLNEILSIENAVIERLHRRRDEVPSLKHPVRMGKKKSGAKKKKSWDSVVKGAQGKGVKNPKAYAAKVFRAQGIDPRTGKKTKKKK
jgi:hypothetical protein